MKNATQETPETIIANGNTYTVEREYEICDNVRKHCPDLVRSLQVRGPRGGFRQASVYADGHVEIGPSARWR